MELQEKIIEETLLRTADEILGGKMKSLSEKEEELKRIKEENKEVFCISAALETDISGLKKEIEESKKMIGEINDRMRGNVKKSSSSACVV